MAMGISPAATPSRQPRTAAAKRLSRPRGKNSASKPCSVLGPSIHASMSRSCGALASGLPLGKDPVGTREVTGVAVRIALQIVLVLWFGFPEVADRRHLGDDLARPQARRVHVGDRLLRHLSLLVARIEDRRTVACADIVALTIPRRGIVDLEEILQDASVARLCCIEDDFDPLRMSTMVAVGRVRSVAASIADASRDNAGKLADQVLHPPEASPSEYSALMHFKPPQPDRDIRRSPRSPCCRDG